MSSIFKAYAAYYDLLYQDKNYAEEAAYVDGLIQRFRPGANSILELGCGTGSHARQLANLGYTVMGVDLSDDMIDRAQQGAAKSRTPDSLGFVQGDLRDFRAPRSYDVVLALFHVMSYQTSNEDLLAAMSTAAAHLLPGGIFVFDCWYGPGVLTDPPATRVRRLNGPDFQVTRIAEPSQSINENRVDVHYEILVERGDRSDKFEETHAMRYLFAPEVDLLLEAAGMKRIALESWVDGGIPGRETWNACFVAIR